MTQPFSVIPGGQSPDTPRRAYHYTDTGNAERLVAQYGENIRYVPAWGRWLLWDDKRWRPDTTLRIEALAKETVRSMRADLQYIDDRAKQKDLFNHMLKSEGASRLRAMVERGRSEPGVSIDAEALNRDPWLLVVANGTVDLRTGQLHPHRREDLITKITPVQYDPEARCDRWEAFLDRIMRGKPEVIRFLQRAVGYSLTGITSEQCLFFLHGAGANGKSTFLEVIRELLSEYATQADFTTFLERKGDGPRNDVARLYGARLVTSIEVGEGKRLNESLVKTLTGSDTVAARFLYAETFEFKPAFKLWLAANHKPMIRGVDEGMWRRMRLIPFTESIPESERMDQADLVAMLRSELSGILAWAVAGCILWQKHRMDPPEEVLVATSMYRRDSDTLGAFIEDRCIIDPDASVQSSELYMAYVKWAEEGGEYKLSSSRFSREMEERGYLAETRGSGNSKLRWRTGIRLSSIVDVTSAKMGGSFPHRPVERIANEQRELDE